MSLTLVAGRARSGKTRYIHDRLSAAVSAGRQPVVVVPRMSDVRRVETDLVSLSPLGIGVRTAESWASGLWNLYGDGRSMIEPAMRDALLRRALPEGATRGERALLTRVVKGLRPASVVDLDDIRPARVASTISRYRSLLQEYGLVEPSEAVELLAAGDTLPADPLIFQDFLSLEPGMVALIGALALGADVVVAVTWEEGYAPTAALNPLVTELLGVPGATLTALPPAAGSDEITRLADALYAGQRGVASEGGVTFGVTSGSLAELAFVAEQVRHHLDQGVAPERLAVVFGALPKRSGELARVFRTHRISFELDIARTIDATPFGRAYCGLLDLALKRSDRAAASGLIASPYSGIDEHSAQSIDQRWRKDRTQPGGLHHAIVESGSELGSALKLALKLAKEPLSPGRTRDYQILSDHLLRAAGRMHGGGVAEDAAVHGSIGRVVAEMASVPGEPFKLEDLRSALSVEVAGGTRGETPGHVQVMEYGRLGARRFDVLIVAGLTEDEYGATDDLSASSRLAAAVSGHRGASAAERLRTDFYHVVTRAQRHLVLVRQETGDGGAALQPSMLWEEALDVYRGDDEDPAGWPRSAPVRRTVTAFELPRVLPALTAEVKEWRGLAAADGADIGWTESQDRLGHPDAIREPQEYSVTALERYLACPYSWFFGQVVRPRRIDSDIDALAKGNFAHQLLERFYKEWQGRVTEQTLSAALSMFDELMAEELDRAGTQDLREERELLSMGSRARDVIVDDSVWAPGFEPYREEWTVGGERAFEFGGVSIRGRVDRIDRGPQGLIVTDYKSSSVTGQKSFAKEGRIQAVIYGVAASNAFDAPCVASVYRSLKKRTTRGWWLEGVWEATPRGFSGSDAVDTGRLDELVAQTESMVETAVAGIRAGDIGRRPAPGACRICGAKDLCPNGSEW